MVLTIQVEGTGEGQSSNTLSLYTAPSNINPITGMSKYESGSYRTPGLVGVNNFVATLPKNQLDEMNRLGNKILLSIGLNFFAGDVYDAWLVVTGFNLEDKRFLSVDKKNCKIISINTWFSKLTKEKQR